MKESNGDSDPKGTKPHAHDVLCGRGGQSNNHPGNEWFRRLVRSNRALYKSCPKHTKLLVAKAIVQAIQQQEPSGRFIKLKDGVGPYIWEPITYAQAVNKTSQALREKDPSGRRPKKKTNPSPPPQPKESDAAKHVEIAKDAAKRVKFQGVQVSESIANLTNVTVESAGNMEPLKDGRAQKVQPHKRKSTTSTPGEQEDSTTTTQKRAGKKRKATETFVKPSWWGMKPLIKRVTSGSNTVSHASNNINSTETSSSSTVTPEEIFNHGTKKMKILNGAENNNADTIDIGGDYIVKNMGRGVVNQVEIVEDEAPIPIETNLISRQSSMFRFLSNTGILGKGTSGAVAPPPLGRANSTLATDPAPFVDMDSSQNTYPSASGAISGVPYQKEQVASSGERMGTTSVQELRSGHLENQQSEDEMDEMPTSGLTKDASPPPPPPPGLKTQMSDWLTSFFPSPSKGDRSQTDESPKRTTRTTNLQHPSSDAETSEAAMPPPEANLGRNVSSVMPPPPGGEDKLGRSVSSTILGLMESPSLFLTTLKSGVSSMFGDSLFSQQEDVIATPIRRFPSSFQQQNVLQQPFRGHFSAGGEIIGGQPILGEKAKRRDSLLDDVEESDDVRNLRNLNAGKPPKKSLYY